MKTLRTLALSIGLVLLGATPAAALAGAEVERPWFYWIAPVLVLSFLGITLLFVVGYLVKVVRPRMRGH